MQEAERTGRKTGAENLAQSHTQTQINEKKSSALRWKKETGAEDAGSAQSDEPESRYSSG